MSLELSTMGGRERGREGGGKEQVTVKFNYQNLVGTKIS